MAYDAILRYEDLSDTSTETYGFFEANIWDEMNYHKREASCYDRFDRALQQRLQSGNMTELDFVLCMDYFEQHYDWTPEQIFEKVFGGK